VASPCVGLDIGSSAIKAVIVDHGRRGTRLIQFGIEYLPPQTIVDGALMDRVTVVEAISRLKAALGIGHRTVATAISGHSVIVKKIQLPAMSREQIAERIPSEAEQHIPFKRDEVDIDYQVVSNKNTPGQLDIILVAAKKDMIADYLQVIRDAKLHPAVLDVAAFSIQNAFEAAYGEPGGAGAVALVHVGNAITHVNIVNGGGSVFVRDVAVGGAAFTEEIQRRLHVGHDEAEHAKLASAAGLHEGHGDGASLPPGLEDIIAGVAETTATKIQRSIDFFLASASDVRLSRFLLSGGSAHLPALSREFEQRAKVPVEIMDPFRRTSVDATKLEPAFIKQHAAEATVAFGLALRQPGDGDA
jgi:type IV pilus assembly protein PilM